MINNIHLKSTVKNCTLFIMAEKFYADIAEAYHLLFEDWDRSIARLGEVWIIYYIFGRRHKKILFFQYWDPDFSFS